jgi:beta-glucosidase
MNTKKFLKKMTLEDKAKLLCGTGPFSIGGFESAAGPVPELAMQDGGTGLNHQHFFQRFMKEPPKDINPQEGMHVFFNFYEPDKLTAREKEIRENFISKITEYRGGIDEAPGCYPPGILLASTWNPKTVYETGKALGMEASVYRIGVLLGTPNCNILREPVNGRFFEGYSEDPFLAKTLAPEMCKGVESMGVSSNVKHFACNNLEINRMNIDELVSMRALREIYFPAFEACCKVASTLMTAYPKINGVHCHENPWLLKTVLREEWGYKGVAMTDWDSCKGSTGDAEAAGQDIFMPGPWDSSDIVKAVNDGRLPVKDLDTAALRVLELIDKFSSVKKPEGLTTSKYRKAGDKAAYNAAAEGIVMLKNNGSMPLKKNAKAVFFGPDRFQDSGWGSAEVKTDRTTCLSEELGKILGSKNVLKDDIEAFRKGATAVVIETVDSGESADRPDLKMNKKTVSMIKKLAKNKGKGKICLILNVPGPVELDGLEKSVDSIFAVFYPGMMGGKAMADIMTGAVNPSGALPCTFPVRYEDTPAYLCYPDNLTCNYGEGIYVGYRGYMKRGIKPLFPFGYGLSYSEFAVNSILGTRKGNKFSVTFNIENKSKKDGKTVVQLYASKRKAGTSRAPVELIGFAKPLIRAGEEAEVKISFDKNELSYFDEELGKFLVEGGIYDLLLGLNGCEDLISAGSIYIADCSPELKCGSSWKMNRILKEKVLTDALKKDCAAIGFPFEGLLEMARWFPHQTFAEAAREPEKFTEFLSACKEFKEE